jgi:hypothetical protein
MTPPPTLRQMFVYGTAIGSGVCHVTATSQRTGESCTPMAHTDSVSEMHRSLFSVRHWP